MEVQVRSVGCAARRVEVGEHVLNAGCTMDNVYEVKRGEGRSSAYQGDHCIARVA